MSTIWRMARVFIEPQEYSLRKTTDGIFYRLRKGTKLKIPYGKDHLFKSILSFLIWTAEED